MILVLQSSDLGADMTVAASLIQIGIMGIPLFLALFRFVNTRDFSESNSQLSSLSLFFSIGVVCSAFLVWYLYMIGTSMITEEIANYQLKIALELFGSFQLLLIYIVVYMQISHMFEGWKAWFTVSAYILSLVIMFSLYFVIPTEITVSTLAESWVTLVIMIIAASLLITVAEFIHDPEFDGMKDTVERLWNQQSDDADDSQNINKNGDKAEQVPDFYR